MADFNFAMYFDAGAAFILYELTPFLQLRYPNQNLFDTLPTTMTILVLSTVLCYWLLVGIFVFPRSTFATVAKHLTVFFAHAAVSTLMDALFPARRAMNILSGLLVVVGHALSVLVDFDVEDDDHHNEDGVEDQTWYERFATNCRRYKNKLARSFTGFFQNQGPLLPP